MVLPHSDGGSEDALLHHSLLLGLLLGGVAVQLRLMSREG